MHPLGWLLLLASGLFFGCSSLAVETQSGDARLRAQLGIQSDLWDKAIVRKDLAAIESNMTYDFRQIDGTGNVYDKNSFVEELVSPDLRSILTVEDFDVRIYGNVALLSGRSRLTGRFKGERFTSHYRYIDVYVRRGAQWKVASVQISKTPRPCPTALGEGGTSSGIPSQIIASANVPI